MIANKRSVLIVDDDPDVADTLAYIVERQGFDVSVAYDGEWALELAAKRKFDLAFFDILLPGMNGVECFKRFKTLCPQATVFMMTGYASEGLALDALRQGANDVMRKPVAPEDIMNKLANSAKGAVLLVDDDEDVCTSLGALLRKAGWKCKTALTGEAALKLAETDTYSTVILDLKLPTFSGVELFDKLQSSGKSFATLVVTGHDADYPRISHPSIQGYLTKPADPRIVLAMVERASMIAA